MKSAWRSYFRLLAEDREHGIVSKFLYPVLRLCSEIYGMVIKIRSFLYARNILPRRKLPYPVVSVGNLTWGGSGKTPFVEYLARRFSDLRKNPAILTRGYSHDEVEQVKSHLPNIHVGVGRNRYRTGRAAARQGQVHVGILDDGFQHWQVNRDMEIVTVNALNPFGNEKLIPRGVLREPLDALRRATVVVITHANLVSVENLASVRGRISELAPSASIAEAYLEPLFFYRARKRQRVSLERLQNQRVTTFAGVGIPRSFQLLLAHIQIKPARNFEFVDHYQFTARDLREVKRIHESSSGEEIITTEKDFYRSPELIAKILNPLVLATKLRISKGEEIILRHLRRLMGEAS